MPQSIRKNLIAGQVQLLHKSELFIHFITALRQECYLYASILRDEIQRRTFTFQELNTLRSRSFYPLLNGVLE